MVVVPAPLISQMRRGTLQYCVLALLTDEERYGFDLVRALGENGVVASICARNVRDASAQSE
jgi:hypothetical protein